MKKLTKHEKNYIKKYFKTKSPEEIAKDLRINTSDVINYINLVKLNQTPQTEKKNEKIFFPGTETVYTFTKTDYIIFLLIFGISLGLYTFTLTPGVAAGDCGELTCAVYFLGGAHSPGYPLYCILGKLFMWLFYPLGRIVYRGTFLSAFCGALTVAFSFLVFLKFLGRYHKEKKFDNIFFAKIPAIVASIYFLFSDDLWAQSIIGEVYTLNSMFLPLMFLIALIYEDRITKNPSLINPEKSINYHFSDVSKLIYLFYFVFGVAMGDHHIILGYFVPFTFFFIYPHISDKTFLKLVVTITIMYALALIMVVYYELPESFDNMAKIIILFLLIYSFLQIITNNPKFIKIIIFCGIFLVLGLFIYAYMPIRSRANAPLDWGNPETFQNFISVVTRKQYRGFAQNVRSLKVFIQQAIILLKWRVEQWTPLLFLFTFLGIYRLYKLNKKWFYFILSFLLYYDFAFMQFNNFKFTARDMFFAEVFFIPSYMINIIWICLGIEYTIILINKLLENKFNLTEKQKLSFLYLFSGILLLLSYLPFKAHYDDNNSRHCWTNDYYGKNLLKTVEYKGILFTEGGDNQVFSLLYHNYIEYLRPDINDPNVPLEMLEKRGIFDQKGNVFLLYGDMMNMTPAELTISQVTNDYSRIKTGRPVYYTWKDIERLREINKLYKIDRFIFQNYKNLSYDKLVNYLINLIKQLELKIVDIRTRSLSTISKITPDDVVKNIAVARINQVMSQTNQLKNIDRFIKYNGEFEYRQTGILYRICNTDEKFDPPINYWLYYNFDDWQSYPDEAIHWDYLTREIIANYNFQLGDENLSQAYNYYNLSQNPYLPQPERKKYKQKFEEFEEIAFKYYKEAQKYGFDMTAIQFNLGLLLEQQVNIYRNEGNMEKVEKLLHEAIKNYLKAAEIENRQDYAPKAFFAAGNGYEKLGIFFPQKETEYMSNALKYYKEALSISPNFNDAQWAVRRVQGCLNYPILKLKELEKNLVQNPNQENLYLDLAKAYADRFQYNEAANLLEKGIKYLPTSLNLLINLGHLYTQLNRVNDAVRIWEKVLKLNPNELNALFFSAENYLKLQNYKKAFENYQKFVNMARGIQNQQIMQMVIQAQQKIRSLLPLITPQ